MRFEGKVAVVTAAARSSAYAAAKGGIIAFTRKLAHELGPFGVNVNAIAPSLTLTERIRPRWEQRSATEQAEEAARAPQRRVAEARDQARVICFLASSDADFVTGVTIDATGELAARGLIGRLRGAGQGRHRADDIGEADWLA